MTPADDLAARLSAASTAPKRADGELMRWAAAELRRLQSALADAKVAAEVARKAAVASAASEAAKRAYDAGHADGFKRGVAVALCPQEPAHTATVRQWRADVEAGLCGGS